MGIIGIRILAGIGLIAALTVAAGAQSTERCAQFCGLNLEQTSYVCSRDCTKSAVAGAVDPDSPEQRRLRRELQRRADEARKRLSEPPQPTGK